MKESLKIIKRSGKRVAFNQNNVYLAIKGGFSDFDEKYGADDVKLIFDDVCNTLDEISEAQNTISVERIQNLIESSLDANNYNDVKTAFSAYRERRAKSREIFTNQQRKLTKIVENLTKDSMANGDKRENANIDSDSAMGTMLQFGSALSKEFAKSYMMSERFSNAHDSGAIHVHDLDFYGAGCTTTCTQIPLDKLFKNGFNTGHGFLRPPKGIMSYSALACIAIQSNQNDQHGGQSIPLFDYYMAPGVLQTYKKLLKQEIYDSFDTLDATGHLDVIKLDSVVDGLPSIEHLTSVLYDVIIPSIFENENETLVKAIGKAQARAWKKTDRTTCQAMEALIHNLNTMHSRCGAQVPFSSINFGTDVSPEGRMIIRDFLLAENSGLGHGETPIFPISIFKVKEGINYNPGDPNYDLLELSCKVTAKRLFPNFVFIDAPFNLQYYQPGNPETEVATMGCRTRVLGNVADKKREVSPGRGNLSFTTINLVRIGIKHGIVMNDKPDFDGFFNELDELMDTVKDQLLERYVYQCKKHVRNFPFLMGSDVWMDSEKLDIDDDLKKVLKHGSLSIGFIGLAECLKAFIGQHHGESDEAQELGLQIIGHMRDRADEYSAKHHLNFTLLATPSEGTAGKYVKIDKEMFGVIKDVTDRDYYTNSNHIPVYFNISVKDKLAKEGPYHALCNAGHIAYIELDGLTSSNPDAIMQVVRIMHDTGVGYGAINHPVDRDPVCGYTGIIGDVCPRCGRHEGEGVPFDVLRKVGMYTIPSIQDDNPEEDEDKVTHSLNS